MKFRFFWLCPIIALGSIVALSNCAASLSQQINSTPNSNFDVILGDNTDANPFSLMQEESLGQLTINMAANQVFQLLGIPDKQSKSVTWEANGMHHQYWYYFTQGITLDMVSEKEERQQEIGSIKLVLPSKLKTKRGIGIGSSWDEVSRAYAPEQELETSIPFKSFVAGSIYGGLIFSFQNSRVSEIFLGAVAE